MGKVPVPKPAALLLVLCFTAGVAASQVPSAPAAGTKTIILPAGEFHEECMELTKRQRLAYSFRSAAPVEFNIHYHIGNKIHYPVLKKSIAALTGTYAPKRPDGYCMMWSNQRSKPVELDYHFEILASG